MSEEKVVKLGERKSHKEEHSHEAEQKQPVKFEPVFCSFCGRPNTEVLKMVKGPGVNICSECTMIAVQYLIMNDRMPSEEAQKVLDAIWRISK